MSTSAQLPGPKLPNQEPEQIKHFAESQAPKVPMGQDLMSVANEAKPSLNLSSIVVQGLDARVAACGDEAIRKRR
jgi:hypothetical protein